MPTARPWYEDIDWRKVAIFGGSIAIMLVLLLTVFQVVSIPPPPSTPTAEPSK